MPPVTIHHVDGKRIPYELTADELREACRALKGAILRQEVIPRRHGRSRPYSVSERNYTIELLHPQTGSTRYLLHPPARSSTFIMNTSWWTSTDNSAPTRA